LKDGFKVRRTDRDVVESLPGEPAEQRLHRPADDAPPDGIGTLEDLEELEELGRLDGSGAVTVAPAEPDHTPRTDAQLFQRGVGDHPPGPQNGDSVAEAFDLAQRVTGKEDRVASRRHALKALL